MADINVKMGVSGLSTFKSAMSSAKESVKTLDKQLEANEKQFRLNGDAELYMRNKGALLKSQLDAQRKVVINTKNALDEMKSKGINPARLEYKKMETNLATAQGKMLDIQTELQKLESGSKGAKTEAQKMNTALKNIGKNVSLDNLAEGVGKVTKSLESGAKAAIAFGKKIYQSVTDSTEWADDVLTRATEYGVDAETVQRMDIVAELIDTDVETIIDAQDKLVKNSDKISDTLGIDTAGMSMADQFWAAGEALMAMNDEVEQNEAAQKLFGRGWRELLPLFTTGREEYEKMISEQRVLSNEQIEKLGQADNEIKLMEAEIQRLKAEFWAENSETIMGLLQWVMDNKDGIIVAIEAIGVAFGALKAGELALNIGKIVSGFQTLKGLGGGGGGVTTGGGGGGSPIVTGGGGGLIGKLWGGTKTAAKATGKFLVGGAGTPLTVMAAALLPAVIAQNQATETMREEQAQMEKAADRLEAANSENAKFVRTTAGNSYLAKDANGNELKNIFGMSYSQLTDATFDAMMGLQHRSGAQMAQLQMALMGVVNPMTRNYAWNDLQKLWSGELEAGAAQELAIAIAGALSQANIDLWGMQRGTEAQQRRQLPAGYAYTSTGDIVRVDETGRRIAGTTEISTSNWDNAAWTKWLAENGGMEEASAAMDNAAAVMESAPEKIGSAVAAAIKNTPIIVTLAGEGHANGLPLVPYDGYIGILHKGERVMTARENRSYTYNSNTYFGSVNLNNGLEIEALTDSIDRRNRRQRAGYGA